ADRRHACHAPEAGYAARQRLVLRQPRERGPARGAVDGHGDDPPREADRPARDGGDQSELRAADDRRAGDAAAAGIVPAAAPLRRNLARPGGGGTPGPTKVGHHSVGAELAPPYPTRSSSFNRSSTSSPMASRTTSCALRRRASDCV